MFGFKRDGTLAKQNIAEHRQTLSDVLECSTASQKLIAKGVFLWLLTLGREIESTHGDPLEAENLFKRKVSEATNKRNKSLQSGAKDPTNPNWAEAALTESIAVAGVMVLRKEMTDKSYTQMKDATLGWIQITLSDQEADSVRKLAKN